MPFSPHSPDASGHRKVFHVRVQGKRMSFKNNRKFANLFLANLNSVILEKLTCANSTKSS